jgi:hypothetical protein
MAELSEVLRAFLWGSGHASGNVTVCTRDGEMVEVESVGEGWQCCDKSLTHEAILRLLSIDVGKHLSVEAVPGREVPDDRQALCLLPTCLGRAVCDIVDGVQDEVSDGPNGGVSGPGWLVDLAIRLAMKELVVYVEPGCQWEAALRVLAAREVQAFVVAPTEAAQAADVCFFELPL